MSRERELSLIVWEHTDEFKQMLEEAEQKLTELVREWQDRYGGDSYVGHIEPHMSEDGEPIFWINEFGSFHTGRYYGKKREWSAQEALENALRYGDCGWCTLTELEQLIEGGGPLLERAMHDCGFRPHKRDPNKWARIRPKEDEEEHRKRFEEYKRVEEQKWVEIEGDELEKLGQLWVLPNESAGLNRTYLIEVNKKGRIYVRLNINPFFSGSTEQLGLHARKLHNRGHIARNQNGFCIDVRNVRLGLEKGIHIKAVRPDETYAECVWPSQTPQERIYDLADDLVSRAAVE